jgi:hypothetical protein
MIVQYISKHMYILWWVYVESLEALGYFHQFLNYELKDQQFVGETIPENRISAQYHKDYTQTMKQHIIFEIKEKCRKYDWFCHCGAWNAKNDQCLVLVLNVSTHVNVHLGWFIKQYISSFLSLSSSSTYFLKVLF